VLSLFVIAFICKNIQANNQKTQFVFVYLLCKKKFLCAFRILLSCQRRQRTHPMFGAKHKVAVFVIPYV